MIRGELKGVQGTIVSVNYNRNEALIRGFAESTDKELVFNSSLNELSKMFIVIFKIKIGGGSCEDNKWKKYE